MKKIINWLKDHILSLIITIIVSFIVIIIFVSIYTPNSPSENATLIVINLISPWLILLATLYVNPEKKLNDWIKPDIDIIPINRPYPNFMLDEKRRAARLKVFDNIHNKILKNDLIWLNYDFTIDIQLFLFNLTKRTKNKPTIWYNFNKSSVSFEKFCLELFEYLKPYFKGKEIEHIVKKNPTELFHHVALLKEPLLFIFDNFKSFNFDNPNIKPDFLSNIFTSLSENNKKIIFVTSDTNNEFLRNTTYDFKKFELNYFNQEINIKSYLNAFKISITPNDVKNLLAVTNGDFRSIEIFTDLYRDIKAKHNIKKFQVPELIALLNDFDKFYKFFEDYLIKELQSSEIEILKFISTLNFNENNTVSDHLINDYIRYSFISTLESLCDKEIVYPSVLISIPKFRPATFDFKIKNTLYKKYFVTLFKNENIELFKNFAKKAGDYYISISSQGFNINLIERIYYYNLLYENYQYCYKLVNIFDNNFSLNPTKLIGIIPKQEVYDFLISMIKLLPIDSLLDNQKITIQVVKIKIFYEYYLWGIDEEKNITYCYQEITKLFDKHPANGLVMQFYPIILLAYNSFKKDDKVSIAELEFILTEILKGITRTAPDDDIAFYQLLLSNALVIKGDQYGSEQLVKMALAKAKDPGIKGQILSEIALNFIKNGKLIDGLIHLKEATENLMLSKYYSLANNDCNIGIKICSENYFFDELEYFNKTLIDISIHKFSYNSQIENDFNKIFVHYNSGNYKICINLCNSFYELVDSCDDINELNTKLKLNCQIFHLDSLIQLSDYESSKEFYHNKIKSFESSYLIHIFNEKYITLINKLIESDGWIDEGITLCNEFAEMPFYMITKSKYLLKKNQITETTDLLESIINNPDTNSRIKNEALDLKNSIKQ